MTPVAWVPSIKAFNRVFDRLEAEGREPSIVRIFQEV